MAAAEWLAVFAWTDETGARVALEMGTLPPLPLPFTLRLGANTTGCPGCHDGGDEDEEEDNGPVVAGTVLTAAMLV